MKRAVSLPAIGLFSNISPSRTVVVLFLFLTLFSLPPHSAYSAALTVNSLLDNTAVDGNCTLREAIQNANDNAATNLDCIPGSGADTRQMAR
jgi:CSLREA domain-containing protein